MEAGARPELLALRPPVIEADKLFLNAPRAANGVDDAVELAEGRVARRVDHAALELLDELLHAPVEVLNQRHACSSFAPIIRVYPVTSTIMIAESFRRRRAAPFAVCLLPASPRKLGPSGVSGFATSSPTPAAGYDKADAGFNGCASAAADGARSERLIARRHSVALRSGFAMFDDSRVPGGYSVQATRSRAGGT